MRKGLNRSKAELDARLDEIGLPPYDRLLAKAHLERAEAISDLIASAARGVKSVVHAVRNLAPWSAHRA